MNAIAWLVQSDPAISWQAMRDLTGASPSATAAARARVPREGLGAEILGRQEPDGSWRRPGAPVWLPTLFTLLLLRATGVDPAHPDVASAVTRLETGLRWSNQPFWELRRADLGGNLFFEGEVEPCINGGTLALGAYFGRPNENFALRLVAEQLDDGGWNCEAGLYPQTPGKQGSVRSSFHTTLCVLEGLLEYERARSASGCVQKIAAARHRAEEYLLERALFRRLSNGEVANQEFLRFAFPPRYHYDVLRALDYFRLASTHDQVPPDRRIEQGLELVKSKRQPDGRWLLDASYDEALAFSFSESVGEPSRWNTLRALRVLRWVNET
jgi:hypothetical protein